ncbi:MAG: hypothetical protein J3K34DRAFT_523794 [Monoraphidium minutum]|nr:MAG: hypothetical protein J3K34DRAFT_523794 [Monoraphidium minutum]
MLASRMRVARVQCNASHAPSGQLSRPVARPDVRAGATPHSLPSALPSSAGRPQQPLPLIVNGDGLSPEAVAALMKEHLHMNSQHQAIATHIEPVTYARVRPLLPGVKYHGGAKCLMLKSDDAALQRLPGTVGLAGAGPADAGALELTKLLLQHLGAFVIAKPELLSGDAAALAQAAPALQVCDVVIVAAGADAALPAAVAALVDCPVLAVPSAEPWSPPRGAAPVAVTAADGGAAAAVTAARMLRAAATRAVQIAESAAAAAGHAARAEAGVAVY